MAVTITGEQILQAVMQRGNLGIFLANAEIGAIAAGSVTSVFHLRNVQYSTLEFRNRNALLFRPGNATGVADYVRAVGDLTASSGALANDANWADTTLGSENVYIMYDRAEAFTGRMFTPRQFLDALNQAMRKVFFHTQEPLSMKPSAAVITDAGFQLSATTSFVESDADGGAATTFSKVSTTDSENVFPGRINGGRVVNTAANGYIRQRFSVTEGATINLWSLTRLDSGTAVELRAYDVTNSAEIGSSSAVEHDQESWQYMYRQVSDSDCKILEVRHQGEGASDDFYIGGQWVYDTSRNMIVLDSTWESNDYRMPSLARIRMGQSTASNVYEALGTDLEAIQPGPDTYNFMITPPAANPYAVQIHDRSLFDSPLVIQGRRAYSDLTTFTLALSETTACPLDLIEARTRLELFGPNGSLPDEARFAQARLAMGEQEIHPKQHTPARRVPSYYVPGLRS